MSYKVGWHNKNGSCELHGRNNYYLWTVKNKYTFYQMGVEMITLSFQRELKYNLLIHEINKNAYHTQLACY